MEQRPTTGGPGRDQEPPALPPPDTTDMSSMLGLIVLSAVEILHGSAGAIALRDDPGPGLSIRASYGLDREVVNALHPRLDAVILGNTIFEWFTNPEGPNQGFEVFIHAIFGLLLVPFLVGLPDHSSIRGAI